MEFNLSENNIKGIRDALNLASQGNKGGSKMMEAIYATPTAFLLEIKGNLLKITESGDSAIIKISAPVNGVSDGKVVVNARYFTDLINHIPGNEANIKLNEEKALLTIKYGRNKSNIKIFDANKYPETFKFEKGEKIFSVKGSEFKEALKQTVFAVAANDFQSIFTGLWFRCQETNMDMVGSNKARITFKSIPAEISMPNTDFIIPRASAESLIKMVTGHEEETISCGKMGNARVFISEVGAWMYALSVIDGIIPNYKAIIPQDNSGKITINNAAFAAALNRIAVIRPEAKSATKTVTLVIDGTELKLTSSNDLEGDVTEILDIENEGLPDKFTASYNAEYLLDVAKTLPSGKINMNLKNIEGGEMKPILITSLVENCETFSYTLMPIRSKAKEAAPTKEAAA